MAPRNTAVIGCWWLLREIELAGAQFGDASICGGEARLILPTSKNDFRAVGKHRVHGCLCDLPSIDPICPFHTLERQIDMV